MTDNSLESHIERELKYQARKRIAGECRKNCPEGDPMVTGITVMVGTVLAMAVFSAIFEGKTRGRTR